MVLAEPRIELTSPKSHFSYCFSQCTIPHLIQLEMKYKKSNKNITVRVHSVIQRLCHLVGDGE